MAVSAAQKQAFVSTYGPYAAQAGSALGVSSNTILGQWAFESNWGTSNVAQNNNNLAGLGYTGSGYSSYSSPQDFTNAYISFVQNPRYSSALNTGSDSNAFVSGLKQGGYFTGDQSQYQLGVASNVAQINTMGGTPSVTASSATPAFDPSATQYQVLGPDGTPMGVQYGNDPSGLPNGYSIGQPLTSTGTSSSGTSSGSGSGTGTSTTSTSGNPALSGTGAGQPGYLPPAATGGPMAVGITPGLASGIGSWINSIETAVGNAFKGAFGFLLGGLENWIVRFVLILLGIVLLLIALWRLMDPKGEKTRAVMQTAVAAA